MAQSYYGPMNMPVSGTPYGYTMGQGVPATSYQVQMPMPQVQMIPPSQPMMNRNAWMISVDGEMAAKAWPTPQEMRPGDVIPLWDVDGMHVYFKSLDGYGRLNPTRKARIVFEDEMPALPEGNSGAVRTSYDSDQVVTKQDFDAFKNEVMQALGQNRQNRSNATPMPAQQANKGGRENA